MRGVSFRLKGKCVVFYSVLRENAWCLILCESLLNWTSIGRNDFIFLSVFKSIFLWYECYIFLCPYRCPNQEWLRHLARCFIWTLRHMAWCFILCDTLQNGVYFDTYREEQFHIIVYFQMIYLWYLYIVFLALYRCPNTPVSECVRHLVWCFILTLRYMTCVSFLH